MKRIVFNLCLLISITSCSKTIYTKDIVVRNELRSDYKFNYNPIHDLYTCKIQSYSINKKYLIDSFTLYINNFEKLYWKGKLNTIEEQHFNEATKKLNDPKFINYDTTKNLIVSFNENIPNTKYKIIALYHWNYSNIRFLLPFLLFGNVTHLKNKCIRKTIKIAERNNADGVIIGSELYTSKIFIIDK